MKIKPEVRILFLILLGLTIRLLFISYPGFQYDVGSWFAWAIRLDQVPISSFYSDKVFSDYLPGYLYVLKFLGFVKTFFLIQDNVFYWLLKIPAIFAELATGILIYLILKKEGFKNIALAGSIFFLLNPAVIFNSTIWGQVDGVITLFLLLSMYYLSFKRLVLSSTLFALAFLIKPQAISIAPIFILFLIKNFSYFNFVKIVWPGVIVIIVLSFPFFPNSPFENLYNKVLQTASQYAYTSVNAYNTWGIIGFWISDTIAWNGLTYRTWGYIMLSVYWLIISYFYLKGKLSIYSLAALATMAFFFLPTKVHERYLYPSLIFLIITAFQFRSKILFALITILSVLHLGNLYYIYIYYNKFALNFSNSLYFKPLYDIFAQQPVLFSALSSVIFLIISIIIIKLSNGHQKNSR